MSKRRNRPGNTFIPQTEPSMIEDTHDEVKPRVDEPEDMSKAMGYPDYPEDHRMYGPDDEKKVEPVSDVVILAAKTSVNFRSSPSLDGTVIGVAKKGDKFVLLNRLGEWIEVKTIGEPGTLGYMKSEFVEEV